MLVSGGSVSGETAPEVAARCARCCNDEFRVPVHWIEERSRNTFKNALESYRVLAPARASRRVYLVTHAWHMPRARLAFEHAGFTVIPAPTGFQRDRRTSARARLPAARVALLNSY